jgi:hypothetical protein
MNQLCKKKLASFGGAQNLPDAGKKFSSSYPGNPGLVVDTIVGLHLALLVCGSHKYTLTASQSLPFFHFLFL